MVDRTIRPTRLVLLRRRRKTPGNSRTCPGHGALPESPSPAPAPAPPGKSLVNSHGVFQAAGGSALPRNAAPRRRPRTSLASLRACSRPDDPSTVGRTDAGSRAEEPGEFTRCFRRAACGPRRLHNRLRAVIATNVDVVRPSRRRNRGEFTSRVPDQRLVCRAAVATACCTTRAGSR